MPIALPERSRLDSRPGSRPSPFGVWVKKIRLCGVDRAPHRQPTLQFQMVGFLARQAVMAGWGSGLSMLGRDSGRSIADWVASRRSDIPAVDPTLGRTAS